MLLPDTVAPARQPHPLPARHLLPAGSGLVGPLHAPSAPLPLDNGRNRCWCGSRSLQARRPPLRDVVNAITLMWRSRRGLLTVCQSRQVNVFSGRSWRSRACPISSWSRRFELTDATASAPARGATIKLSRPRWRSISGQQRALLQNMIARVFTTTPARWRRAAWAGDGGLAGRFPADGSPNAGLPSNAEVIEINLDDLHASRCWLPQRSDNVSCSSEVAGWQRVDGCSSAPV